MVSTEGVEGIQDPQDSHRLKYGRASRKDSRTPHGAVLDACLTKSS